MNMVRRRILENPEVTNEELFNAAVQLEPSVRDLNLRQFNARYPLQVRRWELSHGKQPYASASAAEAARTQTPGESGDGGSAAEAEQSAAATDLFASVAETFAPAAEDLTQPSAAAPLAEPRAEPAAGQAIAPARGRPAAPRRKPRPRPAPEPAQPVVNEAARREVRLRLMRFAESIARAGTIPDAIQAVTAVDDVVDEIIAALR